MSNKFVIKCGNFAVLVDLHALPLGCREDTSWFSQELKEEVSALIREVVDQRVKQFLESRWQPQQKGLQAKQRKELSSANPLCIKGPSFRLAAYFMKRHANLRCIAKQRHRELRVFPERFVVCVSRLEDAAAARGGNVTRSMEEQGGQSSSEYFSGRGETLDPLNSSAITKRTALQKIVKQASAQVDPRNPNPLNKNYGKPEALSLSSSSTAAQGDVVPPLSGPRDVGGRAVVGGLLGGIVASSAGACLEGGEGEVLAPRSKPRNERSGTASRKVSANPQQQESNSDPTTSTTTAAITTTTVPPQVQPCVGDDSSSSSNNSVSGRSRKRAVCLQAGLLKQNAKRLCVRGSSEPTTEVQQQPDSSKRASTRSSVPGPSPCSPPPPPSPQLLECVLEVEQEAEHGNQSGRLPLRISNAEQTNSSRLAASLRGLSVKPVSSGSSIGSRLAAKEEKEEREEEEGGRPSAARTSRLRRPKKS
ncbi:protein SLX4IP [Alosa sapidissima]|uniref:protein SLX4IP n=1 Tax=Alosa sapidissima TaxID=34773 RepID=UPI001C0961F2|nr:protein SLX4IP [Alosa sapidissima]XP_041922310.1 protein SLX4IP [Alosa sapidissima]